MEKINFGAVSLREYIDSFGLNVDDFLDFISPYVSWGDEAVKLVLLDPFFVGWWISDFLIANNVNIVFTCDTYEAWLKSEEVAYFFL